MGGRLSNMKNEFTGCGPFLHDDPRDRPVAIYGGKTRIHLGGGRENFLLLPIISRAAKAEHARNRLPPGFIVPSVPSSPRDSDHPV